MKQQPRDIAWDEDFWVDGLMSGSAHAVSSDGPDTPLFLLIPDGHGDYRKHEVVPRPKGRMGF
jgi:hypothetical protein